MTDPNTPREPGTSPEQPTVEQAPAEGATAEGAAVAPAPSPPFVPPYPIPPYAMAPYAMPGVAPANPFVPAYKEPWVNPAKRTKLTVAALVAALILLGGGFIAGAAIGNGHDHGRIERFGGAARVGPGAGNNGMLPARGPNGGMVGRPRFNMYPGTGGAPQPGAPSVPATIPSSSASSATHS